jgi:hypothetical protein
LRSKSLRSNEGNQEALHRRSILLNSLDLVSVVCKRPNREKVGTNKSFEVSKGFEWWVQQRLDSTIPGSSATCKKSDRVSDVSIGMDFSKGEPLVFGLESISCKLFRILHFDGSWCWNEHVGDFRYMWRTLSNRVLGRIFVRRWGFRGRIHCLGLVGGWKGLG